MPVQAICAITGHPHLLANNSNLRRLIDMRNPYIEPLNILQARHNLGWGWNAAGYAQHLDAELEGCSQ